ncbi:hypothetical protein [Azospirillum canadense]|uniref:hypothetical protein n=1 Tax=Azospirillum canadense TaxID=403962 RepID=UPI00222703DD|nr:hypothetical protein [Azospirillum canadense]MCW2242783.1 hypothetical protein [Azospirillum canadense]
MARKRKDNPTNMAQADVADTLVRASGELVEAQDALEAARMPVNAAKAAVKATGIDFDIFNMFHKIRHLEDDDQRQRRINKLRVAWQALLADKVHPDLFGADVAPAVAPAVQEELRNASNALREAEPEGVDLPFEADRAPAAPASADTEADESTEDPAPLAVAADMPEGAGFVANAGLEAGRNGAAPEGNPHEAGTVEHGLWERGRARGAAQADAEDNATSEGQGEDADNEAKEQPEDEALDATTVVPFPAAERAASVVAAE